MHARGLLTALLAGAALVAAGCGGGSAKKTPASTTPAGTPDASAKAVAQGYLDAYTANDAAGVCRRLAAPVAKALAGTKTCAKTVRASMKVASPQLQVAQAYAQGAAAVATLTGSGRRIVLTREHGTWKVVNGGN
jgi:hypothetical protein